MFFLRKTLFFMMLGLFVYTAGCSSQSQHEKTSQPENNAVSTSSLHYTMITAKNQKVTQINGLGYPGNDDRLYIATNNGLKLYRNKTWFEASANNHHYQSFQAVQAGFLASGHPEKGSGLKDPLGLIESMDQGKSLKKLAFYGQNTFHFLSGSFFGQGIYVINENDGGKLDQGVYYSKDNGSSWIKSKLTDFTADSLGMIGVYPKNGNVIAMATRTGIFYSEDYGNTMKPITAPDMITALTFTNNDILFSSVKDKKIFLKKIDPKTRELNDIVFPFLDYDNPVTYLAADPKNEKRIAFSTYKNDLYESADGGKSWNCLLANGQIEQE